VKDASLSAGTGFVVVIAGNMMLMPEILKVSHAIPSMWPTSARKRKPLITPTQSPQVTLWHETAVS